MNPQTPVKPTTIQLTLEVTMEDALDDDDDDEENDTFSSYDALEDVTVLEAAELDAIALLADTWDNGLDPEENAQLVQASAQAYLSFGEEK